METNNPLKLTDIMASAFKEGDDTGILLIGSSVGGSLYFQYEGVVYGMSGFQGDDIAKPQIYEICGYGEGTNITDKKIAERLRTLWIECAEKYINRTLQVGNAPLLPEVFQKAVLNGARHIQISRI